MSTSIVSTPGVFRPMLILALPVLAEEMLNLLVGYTDWYLTGRFLPAPEYKAAMGLMAYVMWLLPSMFAALAIGSTALISRFFGAGEQETGVRTLHQALLSGVALSLAATAAAVFFAEPFVRAMQLKEDAAPLALAYLWILIPIIPAVMVEQLAAASLRGAGDTVSGLLAKIVVNLVNVSLSAALVIGYGPFPKLGWTGLAIGTACGHLVGAALLLGILLRGRAGLRLQPRKFKPDFELIRRLLRIGFPGGMDVAAVLTCHLLYVAIINSLGTLEAAAHGLGIQIEALAYLPGSAFQVAAATMAGQFLGAQDPRRASRGVLAACAVGAGVMTLAGLFFYFGGVYLAAFFTGDPLDPTAQLTAELLKIVAISMPSLAITMILAGALRGAGDTTWPLALTFIGYVCIRIPGACLLAWDQIPIPFTGIVIPGFALGVQGAWWAMVADVVLRSVLISLRFFHGGWRRVKV